MIRSSIGQAYKGIGHGCLRRGGHAAQDATVRAQQQYCRSEGELVETVIGIALIVIAALEIWFIVRTVQANMGRA
jgi:hypothetical protein